MKIIVIVLGIVIIAILGILVFVPAPQKAMAPTANTSSTAVQSITSPDGHVSVSAPSAHDAVSSPVKIAGSVTGGGWFFEASFPVKVVDADGTILGRGTAQATSDWMTTGTVPFAASITFAKPHSATGSIVLSKDNPSGLPANAMTLSIPIRFAIATSTAPVPPTKATSSPAFKNDSGVRGTVTVGPTCPVERIPPDPQCAPQAYPTVVVMYLGNSSSVAGMAGTDAWGRYSAPMPPGDYRLAPRGGNPYPRCAPADVVVTAGVFQTVDFSCDTGIR